MYTSSSRADRTITATLPGERMISLRRACVGVILIVPYMTLAACGEELEPTCSVDEDSQDWEELETRCDGVDNDCDGLTDILARLDPNACTVEGAQGACASGYRACFGLTESCMAPPPVPEARNGVDDDCNGKTDDLGPAPVRPLRARVMVPPYLWAEDTENTVLYGIQTALDAAGIPYDSVQPEDLDRKADWAEGFYELNEYAMVIIPGYVMPSYIKDDFYIRQRQRLRQYIEGGGMVVWFKPLGPEKNAAGNDLAAAIDVVKLGGFLGHHIHKTATRVAIQASVPATRGLDSVEERSIRLSGGSTVVEVETLTYDLDPEANVSVFGLAMQGNKALGPTLLRNKVGAGAVYTMGYNPVDYTAFRCFVNCFDPGRDVLAMMFRDMFREAGVGHVVLKHTVPGVEDGVLIPSHDMDAPDAFNDGSWGAPGALRMAQMEKNEGVLGTYFVTTDYVTNYYNPETVLEICDLGMCPAGGHSVQHFYWDTFPKGTCTETQANYTPTKPTVCGEVNVNLELLRNLLPKGTRLDTWRSPYLEINPHLYDVLADAGVRYDTSLGNGDLRTNFPVQLATFPWLQEELFHHHDMLEFPVTLEDGMGWYEGTTEKRLELSKRSWPFFRGLWIRTILENGANGATTVLLVHPSFGVGGDSDSENTVNKINAVQWAIRFAMAHGLRVSTMPDMGDFWMGRRGTRIEAKWEVGKGYSGKLTVGDEPAPRLSLAFSDHVTVFKCVGAGDIEIKNGRVVFEDTSAPGFTCDFTARVE